ncbi:MAG TPA: hypothetical protein VHH88_04540 [Verrucomicrobiae bacterium]|nr:hypothetical protein [Verrucomicrobiae bacterium]
MDLEGTRSKLQLRGILGFAAFMLGCKDLLAWTVIIAPEHGWLIRMTGVEWVQPAGGIFFVVLGAALSWDSVMQCFAVRDAQRRQARRLALCAAVVCAAALMFSLETLVSSREALQLQSTRLGASARQQAMAGLLVAAGALICFILMRRRDAGFWTLAIPLERNNEIWRLSVKVEVALRALPENAEVCRMVEQRTDFVQSEVGVRFDQLCEQLIKNFAELSTVDSTARLQMDAGHFFRRYADFHRRLAETRNQLFTDVMKAANEAVFNVLEHTLPGQRIRPGEEHNVKVSIAHPVLDDARSLQMRRSQWDQTLRAIVSDGAATGNRIVGEWIDRAARGQVTPEQTPVFVQLMRATCRANDPAALEAQPAGRTRALGCASDVNQIIERLGEGATVDAPETVDWLKKYFVDHRILLGECATPEISAGLLIELLRARTAGRVERQALEDAFSGVARSVAAA